MKKLIRNEMYEFEDHEKKKIWSPPQLLDLSISNTDGGTNTGNHEDTTWFNPDSGGQ